MRSQTAENAPSHDGLLVRRDVATLVQADSRLLKATLHLVIGILLLEIGEPLGEGTRLRHKDRIRPDDI